KIPIRPECDRSRPAVRIRKREFFDRSRISFELLVFLYEMLRRKRAADDCKRNTYGPASNRGAPNNSSLHSYCAEAINFLRSSAVDGRGVELAWSNPTPPARPKAESKAVKPFLSFKSSLAPFFAKNSTT